MEINCSGSTILYLQLKMNSSQKKMSVCHQFGYYGACNTFQDPLLFWCLQWQRELFKRSLSWGWCYLKATRRQLQLNALPSFNEKALVFTDFSFIAPPSPNRIRSTPFAATCCPLQRGFLLTKNKGKLPWKGTVVQENTPGNSLCRWPA